MRRVLGVVFALYLCVVGYGVFGPNPGPELERARTELRKVEREVRSVAGGGSTSETAAADRPSNEWIFGDLGAEDVGNIAMFVPLGVVFPILCRRRRWLAVPAALVLSGFIELFQLLFLSWRSSSFSDIAWNTLGGAIGFGLWLVGSWSGRRLREGAPGLRSADRA